MYHRGMDEAWRKQPAPRLPGPAQLNQAGEEPAGGSLQEGQPSLGDSEESGQFQQGPQGHRGAGKDLGGTAGLSGLQRMRPAGAGWVLSGRPQAEGELCSLQVPVAHCFGPRGFYKRKFCAVCRKALEAPALRCEGTAQPAWLLCGLRPHQGPGLCCPGGPHPAVARQPGRRRGGALGAHEGGCVCGLSSCPHGEGGAGGQKTGSNG